MGEIGSGTKVEVGIAGNGRQARIDDNRLPPRSRLPNIVRRYWRAVSDVRPARSKTSASGISTPWVR